MTRPTQDFSDVSVPWTQDWSKYLTDNDLGTIGDATVSVADTRVIIEDYQVTDEGTSITFLVSQDGTITKAQAIPITVRAVLQSNAILERDFEILFTNV